MIKFGIITVSTTCYQHPEKDQAGPRLEQEIKTAFPDCIISSRNIVEDDLKSIINVLKHEVDNGTCDVIFTVGGTGFAPSDVTPEATRAVIEKEAPGISYAIISKSLVLTDMAMLSRAVCGIKGKSIIINFPGSTKAAVECFGFIKSAIPHSVALVRDEIGKIRNEHQLIQQFSRGDQSTPSQSSSKVKVEVGASRTRKSPFPMLEVSAALAIIFEAIALSTLETEEVPIQNSLSRVLAVDVKAPNPVPAFPASIKDGYAVRASYGAGNRRVRSVIAAGDSPYTKELEDGEVIRISTGAAVPAGADAVVQVEDTTLVAVSENGEEEAVVRIDVAPTIGQDIRQIGSDIEANTSVLLKGNPITSSYIGVLAMLGFSKVLVTKRPSVGIISTGNELINFTESLNRPGLIYDSNKVNLLSLLKTFGYEAADCGIARDSPNSIKSTLEKAFEEVDVLISSGGVSMGEYDLLKQVLVQDFEARIHVGRLNMKPGKPTVFATLSFNNRKKMVFALPGNPVSCCVTTLLLVIPTLKHMESDVAFKGWPTVNVTLESRIVNNDHRPEYVRVKVRSSKDNELIACSTGNQISSRLNSMVDANGLLLVSGKTSIETGTLARVCLFGPLFQEEM
ncbi:gephyrin [Euwallacea fornicatus]|uniref:gephyrin n=1 Tax=Euwallacea fornicatus TaxID=995702 RepID=UPI00338E8828